MAEYWAGKLLAKRVLRAISVASIRRSLIRVEAWRSGEDVHRVDLERAGAVEINESDATPGRVLHVEFPGDGEDLLRKAAFEYRVIDEIPDRETSVIAVKLA